MVFNKTKVLITFYKIIQIQILKISETKKELYQTFYSNNPKTKIMTRGSIKESPKVNQMYLMI